MNKHILRLLVVLLLLALLASACNGGGGGQEPTATGIPTEFPIVLTATALADQIQNPPVEPTHTAAPATPAAQIHSQVVLWAPAGADESQAQAYLDQLAEYSDQNGVSYERVAELVSADLAEQVKVVISLAPSVEVNALATEAAQVQFLAIGLTESALVGNVHPVSGVGVSSAQRAFLAGYTLALTTADYRVGVLSQAGTPDGVATQQGFVTGAQYYCGICNSRYAPILFYPFSAEVTDPSNPLDWQTAADALLANAVTAMFVQPEISSVELMSYLQSKNVRVVLAEGQNGAENAVSIATLSTSGAVDLSAALTALLVGQSLGAVDSSIDLTAINEEVITPGRLGLIERMKAELLAGEIQPER